MIYSVQSNLQTSMDDLTLFNSDYHIILSSTKSEKSEGPSALQPNTTYEIQIKGYFPPCYYV